MPNQHTVTNIIIKKINKAIADSTASWYGPESQVWAPESDSTIWLLVKLTLIQFFLIFFFYYYFLPLMRRESGQLHSSG